MATVNNNKNVSTKMEGRFAAEALDQIDAVNLETTTETTTVTAVKTDAMGKVDQDEFIEAAWRTKNGKTWG